LPPLLKSTQRRSQRPPRGGGGGAKKDSGVPNGSASGNGKVQNGNPKVERKDAKDEHSKKEAAPAAPTTWAQRVAKTADSTAVSSSSSTSPSTSQQTSAQPVKVMDATTTSTAHKASVSSAKAENLRSAVPRKESPKATEKGNAEGKPRRGGGGEKGEGRNAADDARSLVVRNIPYEAAPDTVLSLLTKPAPEGLGLGPELASFEHKRGTAFLVLTNIEQAQRVLRASQSVKLILGGRELRVEARQAKQSGRQGAPQ